MNPTRGDNQPLDVRERVRRSFDKIKVINPFDKPYSTVWDGFHHVVPATGFAIMERFLAEKWLEEQCKRIMTETGDAAIKNENLRRVNNGMAEMDRTRKTGEQYAFETPFYAGWTTRFATIIREYGLYGGMVEEYGMEFVPQAPATNRDLNTSLIDELEKTPEQPKMATNQNVGVNPVSIVDQLENKGVFELAKIARDKGLTVDKKMKKDDLIKAISA